MAISNQAAAVDSLRLSRKEQVMQVSSRVQSEYGFMLATKEKAIRPTDEDNGGVEE